MFANRCALRSGGVACLLSWLGGTQRRSDTFAWLTILVVELTFIALTRFVVTHLPPLEATAEALRTGLRLAAVLIYRKLLPEFIVTKPALLRPTHPGLLLAMAMFSTVPFLLGPTEGLSTSMQWFFAATSIAVGIKEELTFRVLIQNLLAKRLGTPKAIGWATALFVVYHVPSVPFVPWAYMFIGVTGLVLALVFALTQRFWLVVALHAGIDALQVLPSVFLHPRYVGLAFWCQVLAVMVLWGVAARTRRVQVPMAS